MFRTILLTLAAAAAVLTSGCTAQPAVPTVNAVSAHGQLPASDAIPVAPPTGPGCWVEHKPASDGGDEPLEGDLAKMPAGSTVIDCATLTAPQTSTAPATHTAKHAKAAATATPAAPASSPARTTFPAPGTERDGDYVRTALGVALYIGEQHQWVFCPTGWSDTQCGA